jgi:hypothetical protein
MSVQEFAPGSEVCTSTMTMPLSSGEHFGPPVSIGYYPESCNEIWIDGECGRLNIQLDSLNAFIKQLRRAAIIAREQAQ